MIYFLDFWEQTLPNQLKEFVNDVKTFFMDIGLDIYDSLVSVMGEQYAKMSLLVIGIAAVMLIALKLINR